MALRNKWFRAEVSGKKQSDGAFTINVPDTLDRFPYPLTNWQIKITTTGSVSGGTLAIGIKTPGDSEYDPVRNNIDFTDSTLTRTFTDDNQFAAESLQFTPTGLDGGETSYAVIVIAW